MIRVILGVCSIADKISFHEPWPRRPLADWMGPNPPTDRIPNDEEYLMFLSPQDLPLVKDFLIDSIEKWVVSNHPPYLIRSTQGCDSYSVTFEKPDLLIMVDILGVYKSQGQSDLQFVTDTLNNLSTHLNSL